MTQSFSRFLLCAGLLGASLTVSNARAQDADAGVDAAAPVVTEEIVAPPPADAPPTDVPPADAPPVDAPPADAPPADAAAATSDTAADAEAEEAPAEEEPPPAPKKFWRNSLFMFTPSLTTNTFDPGAQLTHNPTFSLNFRLVPRFYITDTLFLRVRQDVNVEVTNSDFDTYARQPLLSDTVVDLIRPALIKESGFVLTAGLRVGLPVSIASRLANQIIATGVVANASYQIPSEALHLSVLFDFSYTHNWQSTNAPTFFDDANSRNNSVATICPGGANGCSVGGFTNASDTFLFGPTLLWVPDGEHLNISATYYWLPRLARPVGEHTVDTASGPVVLTDDQTSWRHLQYFGLSVAYDVLPWMNLSATYGTFTTQLSPNAKLRNPLWGPDTTFSMTAVVTLDQLYDVITGEGVELTPEQLRRIRNGQASGPRNGRAF